MSEQKGTLKETERITQGPGPGRGPMGGGMVGQKANTFVPSAKRLVRQMAPERTKAILVVLLVLERRGRSFPGRTFWLFVLLYAISRFVIEFYRGDSRGAVGMFSTSQFVSLVIIPLSLVMLYYLGRRSTPAPTAAARRARAA